MGRLKKLVCLSFSLLLSACSAQPGVSEPTYLPSEINAHPKLYEGREIRVRGWVTLRAENRNIWDTKSDFGSPAGSSHCLALIGVYDWTSDKSIDDNVLTISGIFHQYETPDKITLGMCSFSVIEVDTAKSPFGKRI